MPQIFLLVLLSVLGLLISDSEKIKPNRKWKVSISEPSDICPNPLNSHYFIVSDRGFLFETDSSFKPIRRTIEMGMDYEGVFADSQYVFAVEERTRKINQYDIRTLELVKSKIIPYAGGRNSGYE